MKFNLRFVAQTIFLPALMLFSLETAALSAVSATGPSTGVSVPAFSANDVVALQKDTNNIICRICRIDHPIAGKEQDAAVAAALAQLMQSEIVKHGSAAASAVTSTILAAAQDSTCHGSCDAIGMGLAQASYSFTLTKDMSTAVEIAKVVGAEGPACVGAAFTTELADLGAPQSLAAIANGSPEVTGATGVPGSTYVPTSITPPPPPPPPPTIVPSTS